MGDTKWLNNPANVAGKTSVSQPDVAASAAGRVAKLAPAHSAGDVLTRKANTHESEGRPRMRDPEWMCVPDWDSDYPNPSAAILKTTMPQPLDYTRFSPPDHAPGEEQRLADRERRIEEQDLMLTRLIYPTAWEFTESDWLQLAKKCLLEILDLQTSPQRLIDAYCVIDDAARADRERDMFKEANHAD